MDGIYQLISIMDSMEILMMVQKPAWWMDFTVPHGTTKNGHGTYWVKFMIRLRGALPILCGAAFPKGKEPLRFQVR